MSLSDPISDLLTRMRNAIMIANNVSGAPFSQLKNKVLDVQARRFHQKL